MEKEVGWREIFCGRAKELDELIGLFKEVIHMDGPRLAVVLGDRGMGKTRLVQEFYRRVSDDFDPQDFWPRDLSVAGNNLRVTPDLSIPSIKEHFDKHKVTDRKMPYLWWGLRISEPLGRNAIGSDLSLHRAALDPFINHIVLERRVDVAVDKLWEIGKDASLELGKTGIMSVVKSTPALGSIAELIELGLQYGDKAYVGAKNWVSLRRQVDDARSIAISDVEHVRSDDLVTATLRDLEAVMNPADGRTPCPLVLFVDDAQFATSTYDSGTFQLINRLWESAHLAGWPLLLVLSHWETDWDLNQISREYPVVSQSKKIADVFKSAAHSKQFGKLIVLGKEPALSELVNAALPNLPQADIEILLEKADGNPQLLMELVDHIKYSPSWRDGSGLTKYGRMQLATLVTDLRRLILDRLNRESVSNSTRQALALSSIQGMEFLSRLTVSMGRALRVEISPKALTSAEHPHRFVTNSGDGLTEFIQRAYREAASDLIGPYFGDVVGVRSALLNATLEAMDDPDTWGQLSQQERKAISYIFLGLARDHADPLLNVRAGRVMIQIMKAAMQERSGADHALAGEIAMQFLDGIQRGYWRVDQFTILDLLFCIQIIDDWSDSILTVELVSETADRARKVAVEVDSKEAWRDASLALDKLGHLSIARGKFDAARDQLCESRDISRRIASEEWTAETWPHGLSALSGLREIALASDKLEEALSILKDIVVVHRLLLAVNPSVSAMRTLATSLLLLGNSCKECGDLTGAEGAYIEGNETLGLMVQQLEGPTSEKGKREFLYFMALQEGFRGNQIEVSKLRGELANREGARPS